jgi:hypothetical protein
MNFKKLTAGAVMAAGLAASSLAATLPASAATASPGSAPLSARVTPATFRSTYGPFSSFKACDNMLTYVMGLPAYVSTVGSGCFESSGGNSWRFTVVFAGNPT